MDRYTSYRMCGILPWGCSWIECIFESDTLWWGIYWMSLNDHSTFFSAYVSLKATAQHAISTSAAWQGLSAWRDIVVYRGVVACMTVHYVLWSLYRLYPCGATHPLKLRVAYNIWISDFRFPNLWHVQLSYLSCTEFKRAQGNKQLSYLRLEKRGKKEKWHIFSCLVCQIDRMWLWLVAELFSLVSH